MKINSNRKKIRVRSKIKLADWRVSINRSARYLSAQLFNTQTQKTILGAVDYKVIPLKGKMTKVDKAMEFGKWFGTRLNEKKVTKLAIDRGNCLYHGRVRAFVEGLRAVGVKI